MRSFHAYAVDETFILTEIVERCDNCGGVRDLELELLEHGRTHQVYHEFGDKRGKLISLVLANNCLNTIPVFCIGMREWRKFHG
jgi:hypothetical protein